MKGGGYGLYEGINFNCYNSGILWEYYDSTYNWTDTKEVKKGSQSGTASWTTRNFDTLKVTSVDGFSAISFSYYTGTRCSVSKTPATVEEAWMIYHPFSVKEKDISIGVGEECPLTITRY